MCIYVCTFVCSIHTYVYVCVCCVHAHMYMEIEMDVFFYYSSPNLLRQVLSLNLNLVFINQLD